MIILFTIILFENWNRANIDKHVDDFQLQADENGGPQLMGAEESSGEPLPPEETSKTEEPTTQDLTTTEAGTTEVTTQELTTEAKTQELTTIEITTQELTTTDEATTKEPETPTEPTTPTEVPPPPTEEPPPPTGLLPPPTTVPASESPVPTQSYVPGCPTPSYPATRTPTPSPTATNTPPQTPSPRGTPTIPEDISFTDEIHSTYFETLPPTPEPVPQCPFTSHYDIHQCLYQMSINNSCQYALLEKDITEKHQYDLVSALIETDQSSGQTFNFDYFYYNLTLAGKGEHPKRLYQSHVGEANVQNHLELYNINFFFISEATINTLYLFDKSVINSGDSYVSNFSYLSDSSLIVFDETTVYQSRYAYHRSFSKGFSFNDKNNQITEVIVNQFSISIFLSNGESKTIHTRGTEKEIYLRFYPKGDGDSTLKIRLSPEYLVTVPEVLTIRIILMSPPNGTLRLEVYGVVSREFNFHLNLFVQEFSKEDEYKKEWTFKPLFELFPEKYDVVEGPFHQLFCPTVVPTPAIMDEDAKATGFIIALPFILIVVLACLIVLICYCKRYSNSAKEDSSDDDSYDMDSSTVES